MRLTQYYFKLPIKLRFIVLHHLSTNNYSLKINYINYTLIFKFKSTLLHVSNQLQLFTFQSITAIASSFMTSLWLKLKLKSLFIIFYKKLKFKGKGYRIYYSKIERYSITFVFGHSHYVIIPLILFKIINLTKLKISFTYTNFTLVNNLALSILSIKPINIFTSRGIRASKQQLFKKTGKVSTYR
jgi:hypothetical protein